MFGQELKDLAPLVQIGANLAVIVGVLFTALAAGVAAGQLRATKKIHIHQYELATRVNTLEYSISRNVAYRGARLAIEKAFGVMADRDTPVAMDEVELARVKYPNIDNDVRTLLSNYENLALAIHAQVADDGVAFALMGAPFLKTTTNFMPYIEFRRARRPSRYLNLLRLKTDWERRDPSAIENYPLYFHKKAKTPNKRQRVATKPPAPAR